MNAKNQKKIDHLKKASTKQSTALDFLMVALRLPLLRQDLDLNSGSLSDTDRMHLRISELLKAESAMAKLKTGHDCSKIIQQPAILNGESVSLGSSSLTPLPMPNLKRKRMDDNSGARQSSLTAVDASTSNCPAGHQRRWDSGGPSEVCNSYRLQMQKRMLASRQRVRALRHHFLGGQHSRDLN